MLGPALEDSLEKERTDDLGGIFRTRSSDTALASAHLDLTIDLHALANEDSILDVVLKVIGGSRCENVALYEANLSENTCLGSKVKSEARSKERGGATAYLRNILAITKLDNDLAGHETILSELDLEIGEVKA